MMKKIIAILPIILLLLSCSKTDGDKEPRNICLSASIDASIAVSSKSVVANPYYGATSTGLKAGVWFSTVNGVYQDNPSPESPTYIPYHADVEYAPDGMATIYKDPDNKQHPLTYPTDNTPVYCVGVYPRDGWTLSSDSDTAMHVINGVDDIMYADHKSGTWQQPIESQLYKHKLTMLQVVMSSTSFESPESWGKIKKITIMSPHNAVKIDLKTDEVTYTGPQTPMVVMDTPQDLDIIPVEVGSVMCAPAGVYTMVVESERSYDRIVNITLKNEAGVAIPSSEAATGKYFIITLRFNPFNDIDAQCVLIPWIEEEIELN